MEPPTVSPAEVEEIYEIIRQERPKIDKAISRMVKALRGLSDVGHKEAIARLVTHFVMFAYPDNKEMALMLSDHMREQVDIYIEAQMGGEQVH